LRITSKTESFAGVIKFEGLETRSDVYTQYAPPVPAGGFVLLWGSDITKLYFQHTGASGTVTVEIFTVES
jgi:hypothetical protein